jgi:OMF family outer membrane factor
MKKLITALLMISSLSTAAQQSLSFQSLSEVFAYADSHSNTFRNATQQTIMAKYQVLAAKLTQWNLKGDVNFSATDNTKLNTSFLPAEIFGGPAGTFQRVTFGQQYVSNATIAPQIDILNPYVMAKVRVSKASEQLTGLTNLLDKKSLYESLAGAYYNILSYTWQIDVTRNSLANEDTLVYIIQNKEKEGISRPQDVNDVLASRLSAQDKLQQLEIQLEQQYNSLKLLCDIDASTNVVVNNVTIPKTNLDVSLMANGNLLRLQSEKQKQYYEADLRASKKWFYPTLTLFSSFSWIQSNNNHFFDNSPWLGTNFVGLRLTVPLLPDFTKVAAVKYDRINLEIAKNNWQHAALEDSINNRQLVLDYQKSYKSYNISAEIAVLKQDSYYKNLNIYKEGILSATDLLKAFNDWLNSNLNSVAQLANSEYAKAKISINNTVK